jgi:predicted RNase H-like HicB family nuclease
MNRCFSIQITHEKKWFVARCPELNVTSQGRDLKSTRTNLREAVKLYLATWGFPHS